MEQKQCDLCAGSEFEQIGNRDRHGNQLESVICKTCGPEAALLKIQVFAK